MGAIEGVHDGEEEGRDEEGLCRVNDGSLERAPVQDKAGTDGGCEANEQDDVEDVDNLAHSPESMECVWLCSEENHHASGCHRTSKPSEGKAESTAGQACPYFDTPTRDTYCFIRSLKVVARPPLSNPWLWCSFSP